MLRIWLWWQRLKMWWHRSDPVSTKDLEAMRHDIRNAMLGIQYQRRVLLRSVGALSRAYVDMGDHMKRINGALESEPEREINAT